MIGRLLSAVEFRILLPFGFAIQDGVGSRNESGFLWPTDTSRIKSIRPIMLRRGENTVFEVMGWDINYNYIYIITISIGPIILRRERESIDRYFTTTKLKDPSIATSFGETEPMKPHTKCAHFHDKKENMNTEKEMPVARQDKQQWGGRLGEIHYLTSDSGKTLNERRCAVVRYVPLERRYAIVVEGEQYEADYKAIRSANLTLVDSLPHPANLDRGSVEKGAISDHTQFVPTLVEADGRRSLTWMSRPKPFVLL
jgi:hypothetical protein